MNCQVESVNKKVYTNVLSINIQIKTSIRDFPQFLSPDTEIRLSFNPPSISMHMSYLVTERLDGADLRQRKSLVLGLKDPN
jgi:hypothetical protein